jgi:Na+/proline symporter
VELTAFSGAVFAASFFPAIFGGLYLRWGTDMGALVSMITGIVVNIIWRFGFRLQYPSLKDVHEVFPSFVIAFVVYLVVSKLTAHRKPDVEHLDRVFGS